jgi:hypothetical protein
MKKALFSSFTCLIAIFTLTSSVSAWTPAMEYTGWWTGEQIQNIGSSTARVEFNAYQDTGEILQTFADIAAGRSYTFTPLNFPGLLNGFQGGGIIEANQPVKGMVNMTNRYSSGLGDINATHPAVAAYQAMDVAATTLNFL